jgi:hypothetical protein
MQPRYTKYEDYGTGMDEAHGQRIGLPPLLQEPIVKFLTVVRLSP